MNGITAGISIHNAWRTMVKFVIAMLLVTFVASTAWAMCKPGGGCTCSSISHVIGSPKRVCQGTCYMNRAGAQLHKARCIMRMNGVRTTLHSSGCGFKFVADVLPPGKYMVCGPGHMTVVDVDYLGGIKFPTTWDNTGCNWTPEQLKKGRFEFWSCNRSRPVSGPKICIRPPTVGVPRPPVTIGGTLGAGSCVLGTAGTVVSVGCWLDHMQTTCNAANDLGPCEKAAAACLYGVMTCPLNPAATVIVDKPWDGIERRPDGKTVKSGRWGDEYTYKCSNTARGPQWMPSSFGEVCAAAIEVPVNAGESACRGIWNVVKWPFSGPPPRCSKYR